MENSNFSTKKEGIASDSDLAAIDAQYSSLEGTTWNYKMEFNNGNQSSGQFIFKSHNKCINQQLQPQPMWWGLKWTENGNHFTMTETGGTYSGSHSNGKGSGSYVVTPPDASQDGVFTMTKVK